MTRLLTVLGLIALSVATVLTPTDSRADDAFVLPAQVFRFHSGSIYYSGDSVFGADGAKRGMGADASTQLKDYATQMNAALSGAGGLPGWSASMNPTFTTEYQLYHQDLELDYGITDRVAATFQLPIYPYGKVKMTPNAEAVATLQSLKTTLSALGQYSSSQAELANKRAQDGKLASAAGDLVLGAKYQWFRTASQGYLGERGMRFAVAGGVRLPTGGVANPDTNDISTTTTESKSWIFGARTYWDFQPASFFYLNLYSSHEYRLAGRRPYLDITSKPGSYSVVQDSKFRPGMYHYFEIEPSFCVEPFGNWLFDAGSTAWMGFEEKGEWTEGPGKGETKPFSRALGITPYVGFRHQIAGIVPVRLKTSYLHPMSGRNVSELKGLQFTLQVYFRI